MFSVWSVCVDCVETCGKKKKLDYGELKIGLLHLYCSLNIGLGKEIGKIKLHLKCNIKCIKVLFKGL